ncbi:SRPBCC family protein [Nonomuraea sediminis]|uniref:SRPBCC family protein n=1 Tax=Nonomuraea sediminis TaxID=2835864 RepID=UPI001BDCB08B|nr:SRPBCC family protein [Nonomuraea sediminis]
MITIDHVAGYARPPQEIFAVLSDLEGYPRWQVDVLEARRTEEGVAQVRKVMGRRAEIDLNVTEFLPGERLTLQTAAGTRPGVTQSYVVRPAGQGSEVAFHLELDGVPKMAEHLVKAQLGKQVPLMFERLGALLEA